MMVIRKDSSAYSKVVNAALIVLFGVSAYFLKDLVDSHKDVVKEVKEIRGSQIRMESEQSGTFNQVKDHEERIRVLESMKKYNFSTNPETGIDHRNSQAMGTKPGSNVQKYSPDNVTVVKKSPPSGSGSGSANANK